MAKKGEETRKEVDPDDVVQMTDNEKLDIAAAHRHAVELGDIIRGLGDDEFELNQALARLHESVQWIDGYIFKKALDRGDGPTDLIPAVLHYFDTESAAYQDRIDQLKEDVGAAMAQVEVLEQEKAELEEKLKKKGKK